MRIEIWSDVMCPFCYIGKRKFEAALTPFPHKAEVEIIWKSFQLDPNLKTEPGKSINVYLAERKGCTVEQARQMNDRVTQMAKAVGLDYDFDRAIPANSFDAHRLLQFSKTLNLGDALEERLFRAYFTEGQNTADQATLLRLGLEVGLPEAEALSVLQSDRFSDAVRNDVQEARELNIHGVPFFLFNRKYAVSGAQDSSVFSRALDKAYGG